MNPPWKILLPIAVLCLLATTAEAQNGCVHSPECPTAVLGLVGAAGAALYTKLKA